MSLLAFIIVVYVLLQSVYSAFYLLKSATLVKKTYVGEMILGERKNSDFKILFDGDSVGAGIGATAFDKSVAGRVANFYSKNYRVELINNSVSGSKMKDLLKREIPDSRQDLAVLVISSNDLFHFSSLKEFSKDTKNVIEKYSKTSNKLIIIGPGRVFDGDAIPLFLRPVYKYLGSKYSKAISSEAKNFKNVIYVNPLSSSVDYSLYGNTQAVDNFHPNDQGHKFWFDLLFPFL